MPLLLLIRSASDVPSAVQAASALLAYRPRTGEDRVADELLGIWVRPELDADLPAWPLDRGVGIRESFSVAGVWTLCAIEGTLPSSARSDRERRFAILDSFLSTEPEHDASAGRSDFLSHL